MPPHDPQVRLRHMLEYGREAIGLMRDKKRADLDTDRTLGLATLRCLEIVGEAASHIPESLRQQHPQIPWPQIIGTRNRLVHGYELVDYDIIWSTIRYWPDAMSARDWSSLALTSSVSSSWSSKKSSSHSLRSASSFGESFGMAAWISCTVLMLVI